MVETWALDSGSLAGVCFESAQAMNLAIGPLAAGKSRQRREGVRIDLLGRVSMKLFDLPPSAAIGAGTALCGIEAQVDKGSVGTDCAGQQCLERRIALGGAGRKAGHQRDIGFDAQHRCD